MMKSNAQKSLLDSYERFFVYFKNLFAKFLKKLYKNERDYLANVGQLSLSQRHKSASDCNYIRRCLMKENLSH